MEALEKLHNAGQSLWMDHVAREQIYNGLLLQYIKDEAITGLFLSPQTFCRTLNSSTIYDDEIIKKLGKGLWGESLTFDLILEDIYYAADLLRHVFDRTDGVDGWACLPVSPLVTSEPDRLLQSVLVLHSQLKRKNILITVPGLPDMLGAIEEIVFTGIPINISLVYSYDQYLNAVEAYLRGIERRIAAGLKPAVSAFISIPIFHLASDLSKEMKQQTANEASIAIAKKIYKTMRTLHSSQQWERVYNAGARPLRLIWVGLNDEPAAASDISLYDQLVAPFTVAAMRERIIGAFIKHGQPDALLPADGDDCEEIQADHQKSSFKHLTSRLQDEAAAEQVKTWIMLLDAVARKSAAVIQTKPAIIRTGEKL